jgi:hypothetical protein
MLQPAPRFVESDVTDRIRLPFHFDPVSMRDDLARLDAAWTDHFVKQNYTGAWEVIPLRAAAGAQHPIAQIYSDPAASHFVDTPFLATCPYLQQVLSAFGCPLEAVRLMKLTPGSTIKPHADHDLGVEFGRARLHIPITTNPGVAFVLNDRPVVMKEGECWYLNLSCTHSVANRGSADRVHLVIDALVNPWLEDQLRIGDDTAGQPSQCAEPRPIDARASSSSRPALGLEGFQAAVATNAALQAELQGFAARDAFVTRAARMAAEHGYETSPAEIDRVMRDTRRRFRDVEPGSGTIEPLAAEAGALDGWIPCRIGTGAVPVVDWCYLGEERFTAPFFGDTIDRCLRQPFNQLFLRRTSFQALADRQNACGGIPPTAFIFHGSRCGSTLFAQMAASLPDSVVISEAPPVDQVLRGEADDEARIERLRALLGVLGEPRRAADRRFFVKFDAWHAMNLPLVRRAFPDVPCVFLYRQPEDVIASQLRMAGLHMIQGMLDPSIIGLDPATALALDREEYASRVIGAIYAAAAAAAADSRLLLMNYSEIVTQAPRLILEWCRRGNDDDAIARMREVAQFDAKTPSLPFDAGATRPTLDARARDMARRFVSPGYDLLETLRHDTKYLLQK